MRNAARLMGKVFAVVFGAGCALVVLMYLTLGAYYIYERIEQHKQFAAQPDYDAIASKYGGTSQPSATFTPLYDAKSVPDVLPDAELDCSNDGPRLKYSGKAPMCRVMIDGKIAAVITQQMVKDNLAGWTIVPPDQR